MKLVLVILCLMSLFRWMVRLYQKYDSQSKTGCIIMCLKKSCPSAVRRKWNSHGGFSYLEMLMVVFILSLCTGVISDTLALGVRHLQERTKHSQAIMLYDTLSAVVQNDLTYATGYKAYGAGKREGCFISTAKDIRGFWTQYGIGEWDANNMLEKDTENANLRTLNDNFKASLGAQFDPNKSETYAKYWQVYNVPSSNSSDGDDDDDDDEIGWKKWDDTNAKAGQIIRRSVIPDNGSVSFYYSPLTSSQDYSGKGLGGITANAPLYATISVVPDNANVTSFTVIISIYDGDNPATAKLLAGGQTFTVYTIGTVNTTWPD